MTMPTSNPTAIARRVLADWALATKDGINPCACPALARSTSSTMTLSGHGWATPSTIVMRARTAPIVSVSE